MELEDGFERTITRAEFEQICDPIWQRMLGPISEALRSAGLTIVEVKKVLMVGGTTRIPIVKQKVCEYFGGNESIMDAPLFPEQSVAEGAAWLAFMRANPDKTQQIKFVGLGETEAEETKGEAEAEETKGVAEAEETKGEEVKGQDSDIPILMGYK